MVRYWRTPGGQAPDHCRAGAVESAPLVFSFVGPSPSPCAPKNSKTNTQRSTHYKTKNCKNKTHCSLCEGPYSDELVEEHHNRLSGGVGSDVTCTPGRAGIQRQRSATARRHRHWAGMLQAAGRVCRPPPPSRAAGAPTVSDGGDSCHSKVDAPGPASSVAGSQQVGVLDCTQRKAQTRG